MASIDKTYVTKEQYKEIKLWWVKTKKKQIRDLGATIWLYPFSLLEDYSEDINNPKVLGDDESNVEFDLLPEKEYFPIWNTSITQDMWLYKNCPFNYIKDKMKENIGSLHLFVNDFKFGKSKGVWIASIKTKKSDLCFFRIDGDYIEIIDNIIFYGTTDLLEIIDNAKKIISGTL